MAEKRKVSSEKIESVKKIAGDIKNNKCIMIISIKNLPSQQFQKMKKDLREKANIRVAKKSIIIRALDQSGIEEISKLKDYVQEDCALLVSNDEGFEISAWMSENRSAINAKEGQIAEDDIMVEEGPTDLVPGPVISELGELGLQIMVEEGKITIRKSKVVIKKGDKVTGTAVSILQKLGIKPFMIGINPIAFYDAKDKKVYAGVKVDKKKTLENFVQSKARALGFAQKIKYYCRDTIGYLLAKANSEMNALSKLSNNQQNSQEEQK